MDIKNAVINEAPAESKPPKSICCQNCPNSFWFYTAGQVLQCMCQLQNLKMWFTGKGEEGVKACQGNEDEIQLPGTIKTCCKDCPHALWYRLENAAVCYCRKMYTITYNSADTKVKTHYVKDCNGIRPIEEEGEE